MRKRSIALWTFLGTAVLTQTVLSEGKFWVLGFKWEKLRTVVAEPGKGPGIVYWYLVYKITNNDDVEHSYTLEITAQSDRKKTYVDLCLPDVERRIEKIERTSLVGKADLRAALEAGNDELRKLTTVGPKESRRCVAVFNRLDPEADLVQIEIRGLSNDLRVVKDDGNERTLEERVLVLEFRYPGDEFYITLDQFEFVKKYWKKVERTLRIPGS